MASVRIRRAMIALTVIGLGVATYLTVVHYVGFSALACTGGHGGHSSCQTVQSSQWSKLAGVPVALIGLLGYIAILGSLFVRDRDDTRLATLGLTTIGFGFSAYLTYREAASIHAYCEWCLSSAVIMTILFVCAIARYLIGAPRSPAPADGEELGPEEGPQAGAPAPEKLASPRA